MLSTVGVASGTFSSFGFVSSFISCTTNLSSLWSTILNLESGSLSSATFTVFLFKFLAVSFPLESASFREKPVNIIIPVPNKTHITISVPCASNIL